MAAGRHAAGTFSPAPGVETMVWKGWRGVASSQAGVSVAKTMARVRQVSRAEVGIGRCLQWVGCVARECAGVSIADCLYLAMGLGVLGRGGGAVVRGSGVKCYCKLECYAIDVGWEIVRCEEVVEVGGWYRFHLTWVVL